MFRVGCLFGWRFRGPDANGLKSYFSSESADGKSINFDVMSAVFTIGLDIRNPDFEPAPTRASFALENVCNVRRDWLRHWGAYNCAAGGGWAFVEGMR